MEARLGQFLESLGARYPFDGARTILDLVRGFELEGLTNTRIQPELLERRLRLVIDALLNDHSAASTSRRRTGKAKKGRSR